MAPVVVKKRTDMVSLHVLEHHAIEERFALLMRCLYNVRAPSIVLYVAGKEEMS